MNISSVIEISLATAALSIALFGVVLLLGNRDSRGLALFLAIAAFDSFDALVGYWGLYKSVPWIVGLEALVICLYGPAIYLYILTMTGVSPPRRPDDARAVFGHARALSGGKNPAGGGAAFDE
jgi:hypothetical protein